MRYQDFTLVLSEAVAAGDSLELRVQATEAAGLPIIIEPVASRCPLAKLQLLSSSNPARPLAMAAQLDAGSALGSALLPGIIGQRWQDALTRVRSRGEGLRLRIVGGNLVHCVPWEYAVLPSDHGEATEMDFLALMPDVSIVRDQAIPLAPWPQTCLPFRIAATAAHPACTGQLEVARERTLLQEALADLKGTVELTWGPGGGRPSTAVKAHMFHFAGHGAFEPTRTPIEGAREFGDPEPAPGSPDSGGGHLVFETPGGSPDRLSAGQLGVILREMGVRVAVLNACRTASRDGIRSWSSVAAALLKAGVRSVVAMQHAILDASAIAFAAAFYRSLAIGGTLDEAARNGRIAVFDRGDMFGWGTPVLYSYALDGVVFPEARGSTANRTVLREIDQRIRRGFQSRLLERATARSPVATPGEPCPQQVRLRVIAGPEVGRHFTLRMRDRFVVGRAPGAHLQVTQDAYFSRHHLLIDANPPNILLQDLQSTNGTAVNGARASAPRVLHHGDVISGGNTRIKIELDRSNEPRSSASTMAIAVRCLRCGVQARNEQPRFCNEEMAYFCGGCRDALFAAPPAPPGYQVTRELGRGVMGAVYLAIHIERGVHAVKLIVPRAAISRRVSDAFMRELSRCTQLEHGNIVRTLGHHRLSPGVFCTTMERVDGPDARELLRRNPGGIKPYDAVWLTIQLLDGLAYAHDRQVVHRDLKEANILIGRDPRGELLLKISDFGLATPYETLGASGFTTTGDVASTNPHMPPERILDFRNVTPLADVYSAGAVLYRLLTGEYAFDFRAQRDPVATLLEDDVVPIASRKPTVPGAIAAIAERAMRKDPAQRFAGAVEMRRALVAALDAMPQHRAVGR